MVTPYNFPTRAIIEQIQPSGYDTLSAADKANVISRAAVGLIPHVRSGLIYFPYHRLISLPPQTLFSNLQRFINKTSTDPYKLKSYYPLYDSYLPPKFRGSHFVIKEDKDAYDNIDVLSDHFIEEERLKGRRYNQNMSVIEEWNDDTYLQRILEKVLTYDNITPQSMNAAIHYVTVGAAVKIFKPTWAKALIHTVMGSDVKGKKWLDISSGWGDRLLTAMALDMDYVGFDPNTNLQKGHSEMIRMFGDPTRHMVIYEPFEKGIIPDSPYDVVMTSPPYFNLEVYDSGSGQSIVNYPAYETWMVWFLFSSLEKAWRNLRVGGYLILHLGDAKTIITTEAANIFIETYLPGASWEGVIGLVGDTGSARPVWVWKKVDVRDPRQIWSPSSKRSLVNMYPVLFKELLTYYTYKYAPYYNRRRKNAMLVREYLHQQYPQLQLADIEKVYSSLLITTLFDTKSQDIAFATLVEGLMSFPDMALVLDTIKSDMEYYGIRTKNVHTIRTMLTNKYSSLSDEKIETVTPDDIISSLLEQLGPDGTIQWASAMIELAYKL
jgi:hypothetical protein